MSAPHIAESARKHRVSDDDMLHAFAQAMWANDLGDGFTMIVGPARTGALLEVGVVDSEEGPVIVHAMKARDKFLR